MNINAQGIEKWYFRGKGTSNRFYAVHKTDMRLDSGSVTVLTGKSGSGKTTLLHILSGVLTPDSGTVMMDGQDLYSMEDETRSRFRNRHIGMIPQGADLLPFLTVMENILLPWGIYEKNILPEIKERAEQNLERFGIADLMQAPSKELSGGERRRVSVVRALAGRPPVIFADEPTSDLDDENTELVLKALWEAARDGALVFIVTHDSEAERYADERVTMNAGQLNKNGVWPSKQTVTHV